MSNNFTFPARIFTAVLTAAVAVCIICDLAISGGVTWAWYPTVSCALVLLVGLAIFIPRERKLAHSLAALTVLIFPYLAILAHLTGVRGVISVGFPVSAVTLAYLWIVYAMFSKAKNKITAAAFSCILAVPLVFAVNAVVAVVLSLYQWSVWDIAAVAVLLGCAIVLFRKPANKK